MRKTKIIAWLLLIVFLLSACGKGKDRPHMETAAEKNADAKTWTGQGGSYAAHLLPLADYAGGYQDVYALLPRGSMYTALPGTMTMQATTCWQTGRRWEPYPAVFIPCTHPRMAFGS